MTNLLLHLWPELLLCGTACLLLVLGSLGGAGGRRVAPPLAVVALLIAGLGTLLQFGQPIDDWSFTNAVGGGVVAQYVKLIAAFAGVLFVLLAWPTRRGGTEGSNGALAVGGETGEYFALLLLSIAGLMLTAGANNFIQLFLGLELASIPTYIMVSISRPLPAAQEAGVKYFFLGALSAALMLLGFSYLYGATGSIYLTGNGMVIPGVADFAGEALRSNPALLGGLGKLAIVLLIAAFAFKMAAFPLHVYAADVYQGAASPLTAMLSVVPKAAGLAALIKVLLAVGGPDAIFPAQWANLLAVLAVLTMTVGNVLALTQYNVKRVMAYSSVAHSGYMLAGVTVIVAATGNPALQTAALAGTLFYLATYAVMNTGVFAVLQQMPARKRYGEDATQAELESRGSASAETFEDLAGQGRLHPRLGVVMTICALSLVGIPLTGGFLGKLLLAKPLLDAGLIWLLVAMMINAAISAAYYLRIPSAMFFRALPSGEAADTRSPLVAWPASVAAGLCAAAVLVLGIVMPVSERLQSGANLAAQGAITAPIGNPRTAPSAATPTEGAATVAPTR